jgi:hypothetical protein
MDTSSSNSVDPFDVSAHISPPGEPNKDGTRVRVAAQIRQQLEQRTLSVAEVCSAEAAPAQLADRIGKEQLRAAASSQAGTLKDDKLAKLETNRSPQGAPETSRLRPAQLSVITVTGSPLVEAPATIRPSISVDPDRRRSTQMLRRPPVSNGIKFLSAGAIAGLLAGYFVFGSSDRPVHVALAPQSTIDRPSVAFSPLREVAAPPAEARDITIEIRAEPEAQTASLPSGVRLDIKPTESPIEARPPPTLPERGRQFVAANGHDPTCFPSASAVRQNHPEGWPSWTLRAPGREGTKCWYAAARTTAHDHRSGTMPRKEAVETTEKLGLPGVGVRAADQGNADAQNSLSVPAPLGQPNIVTPAATVASSGTTQQDSEAATEAARAGAANRASEQALNPAHETASNLAQQRGLNEGVLQARACIRENIRAAYRSSEGVDQATSFLMRKCFGPFASAVASGEASATTLFKGIVLQEISPDEWLRALQERAAAPGR